MLLGTQRFNDREHLEIGGCDAVDLAERFGTPLYVMDERLIRANCRAYRRSFENRYPRTIIAYAGKAFLTMAACRIVEQEGLWLDVASGGELFTAQQAGFPGERLVFHGSNKSEAELRQALEYGVGTIVVDSLWELGLLGGLSRESGRRAAIQIRCTPGIDPHTHRRISTGQEDSKFGLPVRDGQALAAIRAALEMPQVRVAGIHCHLGSQLLQLDTYSDAVSIMVDFMRQIRDETGLMMEKLNLGGGLGIRYLPEHQPPTVEQFAERLTTELRARLQANGLPEVTLGLEPGRSIVGEAGTTLYRVGAVKELRLGPDGRRRVYVSIDGGMSDNPRPQLYDARYTALLANRREAETTTVAIAGKHCETDILIWDVQLPLPRPGDLLAVLSTGAYNYSMASNYNRLPRPAVVLVAEGSADVIVERESFSDLVRFDRIPARLA